ncbi:hypothetical protein QQX98_007033 [Neonectria punicea]|uniref:Uncharacterized protein n=1 Tax=Neonectria punicea TaxID=979145 RepID=A0ABR1GZ02_9HYPO
MSAAGLVGLSTLWASFVVLLGNSLLTEDGRKFWLIIWAFLSQHVPVWWAWLVALARSVCRSVCRCCRRHRRIHGERRNDGGDDAAERGAVSWPPRTSNPSARTGGSTTTDVAPKLPKPNVGPEITLGQISRAAGPTPATDVPAAAGSTSVSVSASGLVATSRAPKTRGPVASSGARRQIQPLGPNQGQAFDRPGAKNKVKGKATKGFTPSAPRGLKSQ